MRIIFTGTVEFFRLANAQLLAIDAEVVGVCTLQGAFFNIDYADFRPLCSEHSIRFKITENVDAPEMLNWIRECSSHVICFGCSRRLKVDLLTVSRLGVVGFHPVALPANRRRHPLIWALELKLEQTESTFFLMDADANSGDILSQRVIEIDQTDDADSLYKKVWTTALEQVVQFVLNLANVSFVRELQNHAQANTWLMSASRLHNLVCALIKPYVGAHFVIDGKYIKDWKSILLGNAPANSEQGKVFGMHYRVPVIKYCHDAL